MKYKTTTNYPNQYNLCAIVVSYKPGKEIINNVLVLNNTVATVIIVDNTVTDNSYIDQVSAYTNVKLYKNQSNLGVATALNIGIAMAKELGFSWVILFDQDTEPSEYMIDVMCSTWRKNMLNYNIGILASKYNEGHVDTVVVDKSNTGINLVKYTITSGSMLSINAYNHVGRFRDDFFIDMVDFEYCSRLYRHKYVVLITDEVLMNHYHGNQANVRKFGISRSYSDYAPKRYYYRVRNGLILSKELICRDLLWSVSRVCYLILKPLFILFFEDNKVDKLKYYLMGIKDAFVGKMGNVVKI